MRSERHAPGSYCLRVCLCGEHPGYRPIPAPTLPRERLPAPAYDTTDRTWDDPEDTA